jgi:hypothetical protein
MHTRTMATVVAAVVLASACGDSTNPDTGTPGIRVVAGAGQADTVDATLSQALVVEVRDTAGHLRSGEVVRFQPQPDAQALSVALLTGEFSSFAADTTDADGQVDVLVRLGSRAGTALLQVSVPVFGFVDTATFSVNPGGPTTVLAEPSDTTISVGASFQLRAWVADRHVNPRPDAVTYQSFDAAASVAAAGMVTGEDAGIARIVARAAGLSSDTCRVRVQPGGTIAASVTSGVAVVNLDGSEYTVLPIATADYNGRYPSWLADTAIAAMDGQYYAELVRVSLSGAVHYLVPATDVVVLEVWPQASRDASWIYFGGLVPGYNTGGISIWRVHPDGSGLERVSPPNADGRGDTYPSPSPDGTRVAVATTRSGSFTLAVIDVATKQLTDLGISGLAPRWAPASDTIAYMAGSGWSEIWVVDASGGGSRRISLPGRAYATGIDWSPDQRWIIAYGPDGLELVEVATGRVVSLPNLPGGLSQPAWKP